MGKKKPPICREPYHTRRAKNDCIPMGVRNGIIYAIESNEAKGGVEFFIQ
jgi:hypothetical protein